MDEIPSVRLIQISWLVVLAFTCSNVVVTISVALENAKGGFLGSALASGWASVSNLVYGIAGTKVALGGGSPLEVGIIIGQGIALAELYFTIMVLLFLQARDSDDDVAVANDTAGSFALFNVIILAGFSVILYSHSTPYLRADPYM